MVPADIPGSPKIDAVESKPKNVERHRGFWFLATLTLIIVSICGCRKAVSGKYMARFADGVCWLQLVKTPDNHLTGQLEIVMIQPDGKIDQKSVALSGAANGNDIVLSATAFGFQILTLSGTLNSDRLTLTGAQPGPLVLTRSDLSEHQRAVNALNAMSQHILAEKAAASARQEAEQAEQEFVSNTEHAEQEFLSNIERVLLRMQNFVSEADLHLSRFPGAQEHLHAITTKMTEYVNRERQLSGNPNASVMRAQLAVAANQASIASDQWRNAIQTLKSSLEINVQPITVEITNLEQACRSANLPSALTPAQVEAQKAACDRLFRADGPYRQKLESVTSGLSHLERVYAEERKAQEELLQTAQQLQ